MRPSNVGSVVKEPPATSEQIMEAARSFAASLPANVSDADRDAALRACQDAVAVLAEDCDELPTMTEIREAWERVV